MDTDDQAEEENATMSCTAFAYNSLSSLGQYVVGKALIGHDVAECICPEDIKHVAKTLGQAER